PPCGGFLFVDHTTSFLSLCSAGGDVASRALPFAQTALRRRGGARGFPFKRHSSWKRNPSALLMGVSMCCSERRRDVTVAIASWSILAAASFNSLSGLAFAQDTLYAAGSLYVPGSQSALALGRLIQTNWVSVGGGVGDGLSVFGIASDGT